MEIPFREIFKAVAPYLYVSSKREESGTVEGIKGYKFHDAILSIEAIQNVTCSIPQQAANLQAYLMSITDLEQRFKEAAGYLGEATEIRRNAIQARDWMPDSMNKYRAHFVVGAVDESIRAIVDVMGDKLKMSFPLAYIERLKGEGFDTDFIERITSYNRENAAHQKTNRNPTVTPVFDPEKTNRNPTVTPVFDPEYMAAIYNYCKDEVFVTDFITFTEAAEAANFGDIYQQKETVKSKLKYLIYAIGLKATKAWYVSAAKSIGFTPSECSGANVPEEWKNAINAIK